MSSSSKSNNLPIAINTSDNLDITRDEDSFWSDNSNMLDYSSDDTDDGYNDCYGVGGDDGNTPTDTQATNVSAVKENNQYIKKVVDS